MKYVFLFCLAVLFSSCYKNKCYTCTVKMVSADKSINTTRVYPEQYCGKKPKEITRIEKDGTYTTTQPSPITGANVDVSVTKSCKQAGK